MAPLLAAPIALPAPDVGPGPLAEFMLFGPLAADGDPAERCIAVLVPVFGRAAEALPVEVAWDGLAVMAPAPDVLVAPLAPPPLDDAPGPELAAPAPMVWADAPPASVIAAQAKAEAIVR